MHHNPYIPDDWFLSTLDEAAEIILGQSPSSDTYNNEENGLPFYQGKAEFGELYPTPVKWCAAPKKVAQPDDILISVRAPVGPTNICQETSCIGRGLAAIRPLDNVLNKFVLYYLRFIENKWDKKSTGTTFKAITGSVLRNQEILIPPLSEQKAIVAKIEELFSQLDAGVGGLKRAQTALKRYRASVLKAAFEGRLVPQNQDDESPRTLLTNFLESNTLEQRIPRKIKPIENISEIVNLPHIPEKWIWIGLSELPLDISDGNYAGNYPKSSDFVSKGVPFIRAVNIYDNYSLDLKDTRYITTELHRKLQRGHLLEHDILIVTRGSIGKLAIVSKSFIDFNINAQLVRINTGNLFFPKFFLYVLASDHCQRQISHLSTGTTLKQLPIRQLRKIRVPLPPYREQIRIADEVDKYLSIIIQVEQLIHKQITWSNNLRQAILAEAFKGGLA